MSASPEPVHDGRLSRRGGRQALPDQPVAESGILAEHAAHERQRGRGRPHRRDVPHGDELAGMVEPRLVEIAVAFELVIEVA